MKVGNRSRLGRNVHVVAQVLVACGIHVPLLTLILLLRLRGAGLQGLATALEWQSLRPNPQVAVRPRVPRTGRHFRFGVSPVLRLRLLEDLHRLVIPASRARLVKLLVIWLSLSFQHHPFGSLLR